LVVAKRCGRLALARIGLVADVVNRTDPGEEVQDLAIHGAHIADLMPVPAWDDKDMSGRHLDGGTGRAEELHYTAQRDDDHVSVRVPVHVVDESGREPQVVEDHVIRPREGLAEKVAVDLMAGDVPPCEYLLLDLTDIEQLHF
jgi:hypothetical protein